MQTQIQRFFPPRQFGRQRLRPPTESVKRVPIEPVFQLRRRHIQRTGQGREEDKRADKQPDIEMEATQQVSAMPREVQVVILFFKAKSYRYF
jgi:hypothetical protein